MRDQAALKEHARWRRYFLTTVVLGGVGLGVYRFFFRPLQVLVALLNGSKEFEITSICITDLGKDVVIEDPVVMQYLSRAFRSASRHTYIGGMYAGLQLSLSSFGSVTCNLFVPEEREWICIKYQDDWQYGIKLPEPIPEPLNEILSQINKNRPPSP